MSSFFGIKQPMSRNKDTKKGLEKEQEKLKSIKENIENAYDTFSDNYKRWHRGKYFAMVSSLSPEEKTTLQRLKKPPLEFNISEPFVNRQLGEFYQSEPCFYVSSVEDEEKINPKILDVVSGNLRQIEFECRQRGVQQEVFKDQAFGGWGVMKVRTGYIHPKTFQQHIILERREPTMCGFDPFAKEMTKGDGSFCFEIFVQSRKLFEEENPDVNLSDVSFSRSRIEGFNWSYKNNKEEMISVVDYYEKRRERTKFVLLSTNQALTEDEYKLFIDTWNQSGFIEPPPVITDEKIDFLETIYRYRVIENQIIESVKTDYTGLPLVFFDGSSAIVKKQDEDVAQFTRSMLHNTQDLQRLKNFAGQTLAYELENISQQKLNVPLEAIPTNAYKDLYTDVQKASVLVYNQFLNGDPNVRLDRPEVMQRQAILPEVSNTFIVSDQMIQNILGSYDAAMGINGNDVSGSAIALGTSQSNMACKTYIINFMQGLNRIAELIVGLMPKIYLNKTSVKIRNSKGDAETIDLKKEEIAFNFKPRQLKVNVEAGVNFEMQQKMALTALISIVKDLPNSEISRFICDRGTLFLLNNLSIKDKDQLKSEYEPWKKEQDEIARKQAQTQQMALQNDPSYIIAQNDRVRLQIEEEKNRARNQLDAAKIIIDKESVDTDRIKAISGIKESERKGVLAMQESETDDFAKSVDVALKVSDHLNKKVEEEEHEWQKEEMIDGY